MSMSHIKRVGVIGFGAMGKYVVHSLQTHSENLELCLLLNSTPDNDVLTEFNPINIETDVQNLIQWQPDLVIECAGHSAVIHHVPSLLQAGIDVVIASIGVLADTVINDQLQSAAKQGDARLILVSGAVGGLDALRSAKSAGLNTVEYRGRKPPKAWKGSPAEQEFDLDQIKEPTCIFKGTAAEAAIKFPKNANVTAAVALSGLGFDDTSVELIADPTIEKNIHEVSAIGSFGNLDISLSNNPLPENPRTSWLAALSIEEAVTKQLHSLTF